MTSCTIIISHYESEKFLHACIRQIIKYAHPEIWGKVIILDQSCEETYENIVKEYWYNDYVTVINTEPLYSGYGLDYLFRNESIKTDYIAQIHTDAFPVHQNWLYLPIKLIEENNFSFVGQLQFISNGASIYPPNPFFAMAQCFNVARTETYKEMSLEAGFTRFHNRPQSGLTFKNDDWAVWASDDYANKGSDDDVVAFSWQDNYKTDNKLGLAVSGYIEPSFGRIIDDLVFHFCSANESKGVMDKMPELYQHYTKKINEDYSDLLIEEMVNLAKANKPNNSSILTRNYWNGTAKTVSPPTEELNNRIEELKKS